MHDNQSPRYNPPPMPNRGQFQSTVVANDPLCDEHFRLTLSLPSFPPTAPGQFIQLAGSASNADSADIDLEWPPSHPPRLANDDLQHHAAMLRRPFSLAGRRDNPDRSVHLLIIHRVVGAATEFLSHAKPGDTLTLLGPLGNTFPLPPKDSTALLIGGGVGIPPMLYLAEALATRRAVAFAGALRKSLLPLNLIESPNPDATDPKLCVEEFARHQISTVITTDDGSVGYRGFVTQALEAYLNAHPNQKQTLYTCGPEPMMKRVAAIAQDRNIECHIAVERAMACGMGTCQSCCIKVRKPDPAAVPLPGKEWCWRLACTDGPVFPAHSLLW